MFVDEMCVLMGAFVCLYCCMLGVVRLFGMCVEMSRVCLLYAVDGKWWWC